MKPTKAQVLRAASLILGPVPGWYRDLTGLDYVRCPWCCKSVLVPSRRGKNGQRLAPSRTVLVRTIVEHVVEDDSECSR